MGVLDFIVIGVGILIATALGADEYFLVKRVSDLERSLAEIKESINKLLEKK
jgi:prefoldin subunit 5